MLRMINEAEEQAGVRSVASDIAQDLHDSNRHPTSAKMRGAKVSKELKTPKQSTKALHGEGCKEKGGNEQLLTEMSIENTRGNVQNSLSSSSKVVIPAPRAEAVTSVLCASF